MNDTSIPREKVSTEPGQLHADALHDTFPFRGARCALITATVLSRLGVRERS